MKTSYFLWTMMLIGLFGCNFNDPQEIKVKSEEHEVLKEEQLAQLNMEVLKTIKEQDWSKLTDYIHPEKGICFSPYGYFQRENAICLSKKEFLNNIQTHKQLIWGEFDGIGGDIDLTIPEYFNDFVYDIDFINKGEVIVNDFKGSGNSINNLTTAFPNLDFIENYFPGENEEYGGFDWRALRIVYEVYQGKYYIVAMINDQWTS